MKLSIYTFNYKVHFNNFSETSSTRCKSISGGNNSSYSFSLMFKANVFY